MHIPYFIHRILQIHLIRRLLGAMVGAAIAMILYTAYQVGADTVQAFLPAAPEKPYQNVEAFQNIGELVREKMKQ